MNIETSIIYKYNLVLLRFKEPSNYVTKALGVLGIPTQKLAIGWTISVPSGLQIPVKFSKRYNLPDKLRYENLSPLQQYMFLIKWYIPHVVTPYVEKGVIIPELTKSGNIHVHMYIYDTDIADKYDMISLQKTISQCPMVMKITKGRRNMNIVLNYIHYLKDNNDWIDYLSKSLDNMIIHLPVYIFGSNNINAT